LMAQRLGTGSHGDGKKNGAKLSLPVFPSDYIPRGSPARATPCP
jgi:hypothetical protein